MRAESWSLLLAASKGPSPSKPAAMSTESNRRSALPPESAGHSAGPKLETPALRHLSSIFPRIFDRRRLANHVFGGLKSNWLAAGPDRLSSLPLGRYSGA